VRKTHVQGTVQDTHEGGRSNHLTLQTPVHFNHEGSEADIDMDGDIDSSHDFSHDDMDTAISGRSRRAGRTEELSWWAGKMMLCQ